MTWTDGAVMTQPPGHESSKRQGLLVRCDVCGLGDEFFSSAAVERGGSEGVQRLLYSRGWTADLTTGEDACPTCTLESTESEGSR